MATDDEIHQWSTGPKPRIQYEKEHGAEYRRKRSERDFALGYKVRTNRASDAELQRWLHEVQPRLEGRKEKSRENGRKKQLNKDLALAEKVRNGLASMRELRRWLKSVLPRLQAHWSQGDPTATTPDPPSDPDQEDTARLRSRRDEEPTDNGQRFEFGRTNLNLFAKRIGRALRIASAATPPLGGRSTLYAWQPLSVAGLV